MYYPEKTEQMILPIKTYLSNSKRYYTRNPE